jgi:hypothetical protein
MSEIYLTQYQIRIKKTGCGVKKTSRKNATKDGGIFICCRIGILVRSSGGIPLPTQCLVKKKRSVSSMDRFTLLPE